MESRAESSEGKPPERGTNERSAGGAHVTRRPIAERERFRNPLTQRSQLRSAFPASRRNFTSTVIPSEGFVRVHAMLLAPRLLISC